MAGLQHSLALRKDLDQRARALYLINAGVGFNRPREPNAG